MFPRLIQPRAAACALVALAGCSFSEPVDLDLPDAEPVLVVGGFLEAGALVELRFGATRTSTSRDTSATPYLGPGVLAVLFDEAGGILDTLRYAPPQTGSAYPRYRSSVVAEAGALYRLEAAYPGLAPVRAETRVPDPVPFTVEDGGRVSVPDDARTFRALVLRWTDPAGPNSYSLYAASRTDGQGVPLFSTDPDLRDDYDGLGRPLVVDPQDGAGPRGLGPDAYLSDESFQGSEKVLRVLATADAPAPSSAQITLGNLSAEMVEYLRSLRVQQIAAEDPFAEPTAIVSNVVDGAGVFASYATSVRNADL